MSKSVELADNEPCGCGSESAYASCCKHERAQYVRDAKGRVTRAVSLSADAIEALNAATAQFKRIFGRKPQKRDRVFVGFYRHSPADMDNRFLDVATESGIRKEIAYATHMTGLIITEHNKDIASPADLDDWYGAVEEYLEAAADGIDLLTPKETGVTRAIRQAKSLIEDAVIHVGSYADRPPRSVRQDQRLFLQFLLISRCHGLLKAFADGLERKMADEAYALLRSVYECALLIRRLEFEAGYSEAIIAQTLVGTSAYQYTQTKNGRTNYSRIIEVKTGRYFPGRTSFAESAKTAGDKQFALYQKLYSRLSSHVHFDALSSLQGYQDSGDFLIFPDTDELDQVFLALLVTSHLCFSVLSSFGITRIIRRDAFYLAKNALTAVHGIFDAVVDQEGEIRADYVELYEAVADLGMDGAVQ